MPKKKIKSKSRLIVKIVLCFLYLFIIGILFFSSFQLYKKDMEIVKWSDVEKMNQYSYIKISQMSEAFATVSDGKKQIHFIIEQEESGQWHTYLICINKSEYDRYKQVIDYTYERTTERPEDIVVYGYPIKMSDNIQSLAIKNIGNFVPVENQIVLTKDNVEEYLTDTYLDTTIPKTHQLNYTIILLLSLILVIFLLIIFTLFDKDRIVDEVDSLLEKEIKNKKKGNNKNRSNQKNTNKSKQKVKSNYKKKSSTKEKIHKTNLESNQSDDIEIL